MLAMSNNLQQHSIDDEMSQALALSLAMSHASRPANERSERLSDAGVGFCYPHFPLPQNASKVGTTKPSIAAAPTATLHHALIKIRPDEKVPDDTQITTVSVARNEYQSFQVAVAASGADVCRLRDGLQA